MGVIVESASGGTGTRSLGWGLHHGHFEDTVTSTYIEGLPWSPGMLFLADNVLRASITARVVY